MSVADVASEPLFPTAEPNTPASEQDRRAFFALLFTSFISVTGNAFTMLAIPLYVLATTGSAAKTGIVAAVNTLPPIVSSIFGGALIDRVGRRRIILIADAFSMVTVGCIPLFDLLDILNFPILLVLVGLGAFLDSPGNNARQSMLPTLATQAGFSPERAQSIFAVAYGLAQIIGPSIAGICVVAFGPAGTIWINCVTFAISILVIGTLIHPSREIIQKTESHYLEDLRIGIRFVWHDKFMRAMLYVSAAFSGIFIPIYTVLYPVYFTRVIHSKSGLGFFIGFEALGALLGTVVYGVIGERFSRWKAMIFCIIAWLPTYWVLVFHPALWILLISGFFAGLLTGPLNPIFSVAIQVRTPETMRPRVYGIFGAANLIAVPLGALIMGPLIEIAGVIPALTILASVVTVMCVWCAFIPVFRELDHPLDEIQAATDAI